MNPGPTEEIVADLYANSTNYAYWAEVIYPSTREARRKTLHKERAHFVLKSAEKLLNQKSIKVLELGAGTGDSMAVLREEAGIEVHGYAIEPNPSMWESLKANGLNIVTAYEEIAEQKFDLVIAYEVMEHILEPRLFVNSYKKLLSTNGYFLFSTPNAHSLEVQILKDQSTTLDIEHISVLTPSAIHSIAGFAGLEVLEITTPGNFDMELIGNEISWIKENFSDDKIAEFQDSIRRLCFSSHMKVVMKPLEN
jgi:2-polyprenyl-6-hydroxyphenyl methylase / 3-demethylubiquinone-9 3-methyltransferase